MTRLLLLTLLSIFLSLSGILNQAAGQVTEDCQYDQEKNADECKNPKSLQNNTEDSSSFSQNADSDEIPGCLIKGNINSKGVKIYHTQESKWYKRTIIDTTKGKRWFCSEKEALEAGWRAPLR